MILSRKQVADDADNMYYLYLAKYSGKSYHRCEWLTESELRDKDYILDAKKKKSMWIRITKTQKLKLEGEHHFNPNYLVPDRILNSTDLFSAIQPKKANQIKGTWQ